jgi:excisionase family DNA binding protein
MIFNIEKAAAKYASEGDNQGGGYTGKQMEAIRKKSFIKGASMKVKTEETFMNVKEVAEFLGISKETMYRATSGYKMPASLEGLPFTRFGKTILFSKSKIIAFIDKNTELAYSKQVPNKKQKTKTRRKK